MTSILRPHNLALLASAIAGLMMPFGVSAAKASEGLMPFTLIRSLQFVQDSVAKGDHSAAEMQRFMLTTIDARLRNASTEIFKDTRNVDAALVYAMSGGNPATLEYLVARDVDGNFDTRVADVLRKYLDGRGAMIAVTIAPMVEEYRGQPIGGYLALIAGNVTIPSDPVLSLKYYDIARMEAPGTLIEEAALRRSIAIAVQDGDADRAFNYANKYARRYIHSPYASQFADLIVDLSVSRYGQVTLARIEETLSLLDQARQQEVYLRLARHAAVSGNEELAIMASERAQELSVGLADKPKAQAALYQGLSRISTPDVVSAINAITDIPVDQLTSSDRALRDAAKAIAEEVVRAPTLVGITTITGRQQIDGGNELPSQNIDTQRGVEPTPVNVWRNAHPDLPPASEEYRSVVNNGNSVLENIDKLLANEDTKR